MASKIVDPLWQTLSFGILSGMRTMSGPAITSHIFSHHLSNSLEKTKLKYIQRDTTAGILKALAFAELIGDKLPSAPDRIAPPALAMRCLAGAIAGASVYKVAGRSAVAGAVLGSAAAVASAFLSFYIRKSVVNKTGFKDPVLGFIEDVLVYGSGAALTTVV